MRTKGSVGGVVKMEGHHSSALKRDAEIESLFQILPFSWRSRAWMEVRWTSTAVQGTFILCSVSGRSLTCSQKGGMLETSTGGGEWCRHASALIGRGLLINTPVDCRDRLQEAASKRPESLFPSPLLFWVGMERLFVQLSVMPSAGL